MCLDCRSRHRWQIKNLEPWRIKSERTTAHHVLTCSQRVLCVTITPRSGPLLSLQGVVGRQPVDLLLFNPDCRRGDRSAEECVDASNSGTRQRNERGRWSMHGSVPRLSVLLFTPQKRKPFVLFIDCVCGWKCLLWVCFVSLLPPQAPHVWLCMTSPVFRCPGRAAAHFLSPIVSSLTILAHHRCSVGSLRFLTPPESLRSPLSTKMSGLQCLATDTVWFDKQRYDEAEKCFYAGASGASTQVNSVSASFEKAQRWSVCFL